jgi:hypothetical protein
MAPVKTISCFTTTNQYYLRDALSKLAHNADDQRHCRGRCFLVVGKEPHSSVQAPLLPRWVYLLSERQWQDTRCSGTFVLGAVTLATYEILDQSCSTSSSRYLGLCCTTNSRVLQYLAQDGKRCLPTSIRCIQHIGWPRSRPFLWSPALGIVPPNVQGRTRRE